MSLVLPSAFQTASSMSVWFAPSSSAGYLKSCSALNLTVVTECPRLWHNWKLASDTSDFVFAHEQSCSRNLIKARPRNLISNSYLMSADTYRYVSADFRNLARFNCSTGDHTSLNSSLVMGSKWKMWDCEKGLNSIKKLSALAARKAVEKSNMQNSMMTRPS